MLSPLVEDQCLCCESRQLRLFPCAGCKVVYYCSRVHQREDADDHKPQCIAVRKARNKVRTAKVRLLRDEPTAFEQFMGLFWRVHETRPRMQARKAFINELCKLPTQEAVGSALNIALESLKLCKNDGIGIRNMVPFLLILLGREQEAYSFIKWWQDSEGDANSSYLDLPDQDLFEDVSFINQLRWTDGLAFKSALTLIKYRLLADLQSLQRSLSDGEASRERLLDAIEEDSIESPIVDNQALMEDVASGRSIQPYIASIWLQLITMLRVVHEHNKHFWLALAKSDGDMASLPERLFPGSKEEVDMVLYHSGYAAWDDSLGALKWLRKTMVL